MSDLQWIPLESNPQVFNKYTHALGLPTDWNFMDVVSLDDDMLAMLPKPVAGVLFIYPITEKSEGNSFGNKLQDMGDVYFMKQTVSNACGTVALLHTIGNNRKLLKLEPNSTLDRFFNKSTVEDCTPEDRAKLLETDEVQRKLKLLAKLIWSGSTPAQSSLNSAHEAAACEGQTEAPSRDTRTNLHFVSLVANAGRLIELDGRIDGPIEHGPTSEESFLSDCAKVIQKFMQREAQDLQFSIVALAKGEPLF